MVVRMHLRRAFDGACERRGATSSSLLLSSLTLSDTEVYEPWIRALLRTASQLRPIRPGMILAFIFLTLVQEAAFC